MNTEYIFIGAIGFLSVNFINSNLTKDIIFGTSEKGTNPKRKYSSSI